MPFRSSWFFAILLAGSLLPPLRAGVGDTRVATWKGDREAAILLMFDDGWPGQVEVAIPALRQRGLVATFYMVPGKGEYKAHAAKWAEALKGGGVVYGNHTMPHGGVRDYEHAKTEIGACSDSIRALQPGKPNRLVSFAQPGVPKGKWTLPKEDLVRVLAENNTIDRPPFAGHGAVYHWQTLEQMTALADKAVTTGGMEYLVIHGVERVGAKWQDFWPLKQDIFPPLLDHLKAAQDKGDLWVTDHISWHQYKTERESAAVTILQAVPTGIRI